MWGPLLAVHTHRPRATPPHFLLESAAQQAGCAGSELLEAGLAVNLLAALLAAVGSWRRARIGWSAGIVIAAVSLACT